MPYLDVPPAMVERVVCSITAAIKYQVPANIMLAVAEKEGGKPGLENKNRNDNGTYDMGPMQFNTVYLRDLAKYGITAEDVAQPGCYSFDLAAWRIRGHIKNDRGDIWTKAANYHSRTPYYNSIYRSDLIRKAAKWQTWIEARFNTFDATAPAPQPPQPQLAAQQAAPQSVSVKPTQPEVDTAAHSLPLPTAADSSTTPATPEQLVGFTASVKTLPVSRVSQNDYRETVQPLQFNKAAADALAAVYGRVKLR
ncbi:conjugal transfer protein [Pantoea sp. Mb-10]|uniref:conjugal transfer protein n=1 Tax=unclassified Pantoea TaxID=2630326 RepID=UPI001E2BEE99|nr:MULTISPECIES: conjugal transfer protein [unclassified Pantoea]MCE0491168.1 conjugal transfer protein [Pantoea sp. Mb-10]MCE0502657.1 conjugal transfer protein [Pantoea sp. Pb-8]